MMKIKGVRVLKSDNDYDLFIEVKLDNDELIFCNDSISNYKKIKKIEEANDEDFVVTNKSIMDVVEDEEKYELMMREFKKYKIEINDVEKYNSYLNILLKVKAMVFK